jgi:hypothetical protein
MRQAEEDEAEQQAKTSNRHDSNENSASQFTEIDSFSLIEGRLKDKTLRQERAGAAPTTNKRQ